MSRFLAVVCGGVAIGWLVGLSHSPVVGVVITAVVGALVASASALSDAREARYQLALWPLATFAGCIALVAPIGIVAREHGWFAHYGAKPAAADAWAEQSKLLTMQHAYWVKQGIAPAVVSRALFDAHLKGSTTPQAGPDVNPQKPSSGLWADARELCAGLDSTQPIEKLRPVLRQSTSAVLSALAQVTDDAKTRAALEEACK